MKGLKVEIDEIPLPEKNSRIGNLFGVGTLILIGIPLLPFVLILLIIGIIVSLFPSRKIVSVANEWKTIVSDQHLTLKFRWISVDYLYGYFDSQPLNIGLTRK